MKKLFKIIISVTLVLALIITGSSYAFAKQEMTEEEIDARVEEILNTMSYKERVAQMLYVFAPIGKAKAEQEKYQYGGYLLFADFFKSNTKKNVKKVVKNWQKASKVNMLIGVDEEGGTVVRVSKFKQYRKTPFKAPKDVYKKGGYAAVEKDAHERAKLLKSLGINTNFAPVADVAYKKGNYIYNRSFSTNYKKVSKFVKCTVNAYNEDNLVSIMKHFPGYGGNGNTHTYVIKDTRSLETFESRDLKPFAAGIKNGAPMILVNHDIVRCIDKKNTASLSKKVHKYLRKNMGFDGVIITDALGMSGVTKKVSNNGEAAVLAVLAGNDMLCTPYGKTSRNAIFKAVKSGRISKEQINNSVRRILKMKIKYGIIR